MARNASARQPTAVMKGAFSVPIASVTHSATIPAKMATMLLRVVMVLKMLLSVEPGSSGNKALYSVTIQLSKTLYMSVVATPPRILPINSMAISSVRRARQESEYITQNARQAARRPYRSASFPVKEAATAPARKPVMKRAATTSSASPFSSRNNRQSHLWYQTCVEEKSVGRGTRRPRLLTFVQRINVWTL